MAFVCVNDYWCSCTERDVLRTDEQQERPWAYVCITAYWCSCTKATHGCCTRDCLEACKRFTRVHCTPSLQGRQTASARRGNDASEARAFAAQPLLPAAVNAAAFRGGAAEPAAMAEMAAGLLVQEALRRGTQDNVTAVVSVFQWD